MMAADAAAVAIAAPVMRTTPLMPAAMLALSPVALRMTTAQIALSVNPKVMPTNAAKTASSTGSLCATAERT